MSFARFSPAALVLLLGVPLSAHSQAPGSLGPAQSPGATVDGEVVDNATGQKLVRASVVLRSMADASTEYRTTTDEQGKYRLTMDQIKAGFYLLEAQKPGFATLIEHNTKGTTFMLRPGDSKHDLILRMLRSGAIAGRILDPDGEPVVGISVRAEIGDYTMVSTTSDEQGRFRIEGLARGSYRLRAVVPRNLSSAREIRSDGSVDMILTDAYYPSSPDLVGSGQLSVLEGSEAAGIDISVTRAAVVRVSGTVASEQQRVIGASLELRTSGHPNEFQRITVRPNGTFEMWRIDPGQYWLRAFMMSGNDLLRSSWVALDVAHEDINGLTLSLFPPFQVLGNLREDSTSTTSPPKASPGPSRTVIFQSVETPQNTVRATVEAGGTFTLKSMTMGKYRVISTGSPIFIKSWTLDGIAYDGDVLDLSTSNPIQKLELLVSSNTAEISGLVSGSKGPLARTSVVVTQPSAAAGVSRFVKAVSTIDDGTFRLSGLAPGSYRIQATDEDEIASVHGDFSSYADVSVAVTLQAGDKKQGLELRHH